MARLLRIILFVNQLWFEDTSPGTNIPFWSLGFEVWYYIIFGAFRFIPGKGRWLAALALMTIAGPRILALFPLWVAGLLTYRVCARLSVARGLGGAIAFTGVAAGIALEAWGGGTGAGPENYVQDYALGMALCSHIAGVKWLTTDWTPPNRIVAIVRFLANRTFSTYLYHLPIASFLIAIIPWPPGSFGGRAAIVAGTLVGCFLLAQWTELNKRPWRVFFGRCLDWVHLRIGRPVPTTRS